MNAITKGSMRTTWMFFIGAAMVVIPQIQAALDAAERGTDVNWFQVGLAAAMAVGGYLARDNGVTSKEAGAE